MNTKLRVSQLDIRDNVAMYLYKYFIPIHNDYVKAAEDAYMAADKFMKVRDLENEEIG